MKDSSFIVACCHPKGEAEDYDGLFYRDCEFDQLAAGLIDKPLLFNHEESVPLGKVVTAWADSPIPGSKEPRQVFALCEIDDSTVNGKLAKQGIDKEVLQDVSIGHTCKIDHSANVSQVTAKQITELSICERGAREHTHIYGTSWAEAKKQATPTYIKVTASAQDEKSNTRSIQKMSAPMETTPTPATTETTESVTQGATEVAAPVEKTVTEEVQAPKVDLTRNVLAQLKKLQEENTRLAADLNTYQETSRKEREAEMNSGVKDYMEKLIADNPELANHEAELKALMTKMVDSETATPLVKLLKCAASKSTHSVTELEKQYQLQKSKDKRIKELTDELEALKSDAFALTEERVQVGASAGLKRARVEEKAPVKKDIFAEISESLRGSAGNGVPRLHAEEFHMPQMRAREQFL